MTKLREQYDAIYISIGAHTDKKVGLEGEDARGVISAVEMLGELADGGTIDMKGKKVAVINRYTYKDVTVVYRRRQVDMTALAEEVRSAIAEGAQIRELHAPVRIETNENNEVTALIAQPKLIGKVGRDGRPARRTAASRKCGSPAISWWWPSARVLRPTILKTRAFPSSTA